MRCGHFKAERQAMAVTDPDGTYCGAMDFVGAQQAFNRAYRKWKKRRGLPDGKFNLVYGKQERGER